MDSVILVGFYTFGLLAVLTLLAMFLCGVWRLVRYRVYRWSLYGWAWLLLVWLNLCAIAPVIGH